MLKLQEFIKENNNFREILAEKPYAIKMQEDEHFMMFKYSQIDSNFNNDIVRECRGIILDKADWSISCHPFPKFGNYGEGYVPEIDWKTASVQEKLDGSLIKRWWNKYIKDFQWSTNGTIDASSADLQENVIMPEIKNFKDLILHTIKEMGEENLLGMKDHTDLFELCTPLNKVVVPHKDYKLYHLSTKHNKTGVEVLYNNEFPKPKRYPLHSLEECIKSANELPFNEEGYVVVDDRGVGIAAINPAAHLG